MEKHSVVFLINSEEKWPSLLRHVEILAANAGAVNQLAVVAINSSILSCLKSMNIVEQRQQLEVLSQKGIQLFICGNTCKRYGITADQILPFFTVAVEGGIAKILSLEAEGFKLIQE